MKLYYVCSKIKKWNGNRCAFSSNKVSSEYLKKNTTREEKGILAFYNYIHTCSNIDITDIIENYSLK